ncbi:GyrI-like domain-containing protein [Roseivirga sp. E12]|uniref:helix-turn-helix domain-containing protein n=1 Tax=Roseivirga sp. E12 TaxID=2819237 RepID=UPI001ABCCDB6|nr:GyrI-like domain-containing protein [Roseivirga sp. E12]MBO3700626.1 GyrI-like domain-containing protein [Roseivirga sp. E12]
MSRASIERSIAFIEAHLQDGLSLDLISEVACLSKYHFSRVFKKHTGDRVADYIRRRRITLSAAKLISSQESILQIAINHRFDSQEAFTRSFKGVYGMTPNEYRKNGVNILAHSRSPLTLDRIEHLQNKISLEPEIVIEPARNLVGLHCKTSMVQNNIPMLWTVFRRRQHEIKNTINNGRFGVSDYKNLKVSQFTPSAMIGKWATVEVSSQEEIPEEMVVYNLSGGLYARFMHKGGKKNVQMSFEYIYSTWLPNTKYEIDNRDHFEHYPKVYLGPENPESELFIFLPIKLTKATE